MTCYYGGAAANIKRWRLTYKILQLIIFHELLRMMTSGHLQEMRRRLRSKKFKNELKMVRSVCSQPRFKIMVALCHNLAGLTVSDIAEILQAPISRISHQLAILRGIKVVRRRRRNREMIYTLDARPMRGAHDCLHRLFHGH